MDDAPAHANKKKLMMIMKTFVFLFQVVQGLHQTRVGVVC